MIKHLFNELRSLFTIKGIFIIFYGLPLAIFIRIISKIFLIRIMKINSERIGELIINPAIYLYQKENNINKASKYCLDIFFFKTDPINTQICKMLKREINIYPNYLIEPIYEAQKKISYLIKNQEKYSPLKKRRFKFHYIDKLPYSKKNINFLLDEKDKGKKELLEKFGVGENDKFVCFLVRDQEFLKKLYPGSDFSSHEYRNINISNFIEAAKALSKRGYYVFRMGKFQEKSFNTEDPKIIDYANSEFRSDFLDIYLSAHCKFFLTTMSGLDNLLPIFNIPTIVIPLNLAIARQYKNYLISTKVFVNEHNEKVSLKELFEKDLIFRQKKEDFDKAKIKPLDPTSSQIHKLVIEMDDHIINGKKYNQEEEELNQKFWNIYCSLYNKDKNAKDEISVNGKLKIYSRFDISFLKENHDWFLN